MVAIKATGRLCPSVRAVNSTYPFLECLCKLGIIDAFTLHSTYRAMYNLWFEQNAE